LIIPPHSLNHYTGGKPALDQFPTKCDNGIWVELIFDPN